MIHAITLCAVACFFIVGVFLFNSGKFGAAGFNAYLGIVLVACLAFYGFDRLKELDLKNLRIVLSEISQTKKEIYAKAESVKKMGEEVAELVAYNIAWANRFVGEDHVDKMVAARSKVLSLLKDIDSETGRRDEILGQIDHFVIRDLAAQTVEAAARCEGSKLTNESRVSLQASLEEKSANATLGSLQALLGKHGARCPDSERSIARLHEFASERKLSIP